MRNFTQSYTFLTGGKPKYSGKMERKKRNQQPNGLRYWCWGKRGQCLGAEKTRSQKNACKSRRLPHVGCTLCW